MQKVSVFDFVAIVALWFGGVNWGLVGLFQYDLVEKIFGSTQSTGARIVYSSIALATLYIAISAYVRESRKTAPLSAKRVRLPSMQ
jgi:hypothetical protein